MTTQEDTEYSSQVPVTPPASEHSTDHLSAMETLELIFTEGVYLKLISLAMKSLILEATMGRQLILKKLWTSFLSTLTKLLMNRKKGIKTMTSSNSYEKLRDLTCDEELYTILLELQISKEQYVLLWDKLKLHLLKEDYSGCLDTGTTSTSCMTVIGAPATVSEPESQDCQLNAELDEIFGNKAVVQSDGEISPNISYRKDGKIFSLKWEDSLCRYYWKIEKYRMKNLESIPKSEYWKHAEVKMIFGTSSQLDPVQAKLDQIVKIVSRRLSEFILQCLCSPPLNIVRTRA